MTDSSPLDGLLVADFSRVLAGPFATMLLADLGATVVKVERPRVGDETRTWGPPWTESGASSYFESVNRGKHSIELDLNRPADLALAQELTQRADIVVENFRPGLLDQHGLDYQTVAEQNPRVVYCSISGFGSGDGAAMPGYDFVVQAVGGLMSVTGAPDGDPMKVGVALVDVLTGKDAVIGILASLLERESSGRGQHVEVNLLSSLLGSLVNQVSGYLASGVDPVRMGNTHPSIAPYETFRCADGVIAVACGNDDQFRRFAAVLARPDLPDDPRFASNTARVSNRADLAQEAEQELARHPAEVWQERFLAARVAAGAVGSISQAIHLAEQLGLNPTWDAGPGHIHQVTHPIAYSRTAVARPSAPPALGEHNQDVTAWLRGNRTERLEPQETQS